MTGKSRTRQHTPRVALYAAATALLAGGCTSSNLNLSTGTSSSAPTTTSATKTVAPTTIATVKSRPRPTTTVPPTTSIVATSGLCQPRSEYGYILPDPTCTPGAVNPQVTAGNTGQTICAYGWTKTVRPPYSYAESLKRFQMSEYGETQPIHDYEEDHLIPLELGGAPSDPHNLWPDPGASPNPKDKVEDAANRAVCDGKISLATAQHEIAADWVAFGRGLHVIRAPGTQSP